MLLIVLWLIHIETIALPTQLVILAIGFVWFIVRVTRALLSTN